MSKSVNLADLDFSELTDHMTRMVHTKFIEDGGSGLRNGIALAMNTCLTWDSRQKEKKKDEANSRRR